MDDTLFENDFLRLWRDPDIDAGIAILSFKTKMHTVGREVLDAAPQQLARAGQEFDGLVLWSGRPFCAGADLRQFLQGIDAADWNGIDAMIADFQRFSLALRYSLVPTVAAVEGPALGGGCELALHCARRVLAPDASLGLVESLAGLIPGGAGCVALARRGDIGAAFEHLLAAARSADAQDAKALGYAEESDPIVADGEAPLHAALRQARALADAGYHPPVPAPVAVAGRTVRAVLEAELQSRLTQGRISAHDARIGCALARALCGGGCEPGALLDDVDLCRIERREFMTLIQTPETRARIAHLLETGKPLRN